MATISALLTAPDARLVMRSLEIRLRESQERAGSADQRRADAFVQFFTEELLQSSTSSTATSGALSFQSTSAQTSGVDHVSSPEPDLRALARRHEGEKSDRKNSAMTIKVICD